MTGKFEQCIGKHPKTGTPCSLPASHVKEGLLYHQNGPMRWSEGGLGWSNSPLLPRNGDECVNPKHDIEVMHKPDRSDCYTRDAVIDDGPKTFAEIQRDANGAVTGMTWIHPDRVCKVTNRDGEIIAYGVKL